LSGRIPLKLMIRVDSKVFLFPLGGQHFPFFHEATLHQSKVHLKVITLLHLFGAKLERKQTNSTLSPITTREKLVVVPFHRIVS
jgi:hypothetical protein